MTSQGRGGYRKPANPAPVSLPQSGRRTDGGAGDKQPIRTPTGGAYGEAKALTEQQQGAPLPAGGPTTPEGGAAPVTPQPTPDLFRPTERPAEQMQAVPAPSTPPADMVLRQLASAYPTPWIMRMVNNGSTDRR